jgi:hypothetical protein
MQYLAPRPTLRLRNWLLLFLDDGIVHGLTLRGCAGLSGDVSLTVFGNDNFDLSGQCALHLLRKFNCVVINFLCRNCYIGEILNWHSIRSRHDRIIFAVKFDTSSSRVVMLPRRLA